MRYLIGLGILLSLFALAWSWQGRLQADISAEPDRQRAEMGLSPLHSGKRGRVEQPWSKVIVGRPSGREPLQPSPAPRQSLLSQEVVPEQFPPASNSLPAPAASPKSQPAPATASKAMAAPPTASKAQRESKSESWIVQHGQTLQAIVRSRYGRATPALMEQVARYNGLTDPNRLRVGQPLRLPGPDVLARDRR